MVIKVYKSAAMGKRRASIGQRLYRRSVGIKHRIITIHEINPVNIVRLCAVTIPNIKTVGGTMYISVMIMTETMRRSLE